jgi:S1-C subfamily serine protease
MRNNFFHKIVLLGFLGTMTLAPAWAETSILLSLMQTTQALVVVEAENAAVYGDSAKPLIDERTGAILLHRSVRPVIQTRTGTGIIINPSGFIITNAHTVQQAARVTVTLYDNVKHQAELLFVVPQEDLALLKIDAGHPLPAVPLTNSDEAQLNAKVYTIGGSPLLRNTISEGAISALGVPRGQSGLGENIKFLQVTFNIYQGDSGSPLLAADGRLLGIMMGAQTHQDRIAYAIPSNMISKVIQDYVKQNKGTASAL